MNEDVAYGQTTLPVGIRSRFVPGVNGITLHVLEAGFEEPGRPAILLLHGFPELAYSWRKLLLPLAAAGYHVIAPDQRGYGRSDGTDAKFEDELWDYTLLNKVRDTMALVFAIGHRSVDLVVGHDYGSPVAAWSALTRPDVFRSVVMISSPFEGSPPLTVRDPDAERPARRSSGLGIHEELAALDPPRKHYHWYYSTAEANEDMQRAPQGVHDFLCAYYHCKSADWQQNLTHPLAAWSADELAKLPRYYVMDLDRTMPECVAPEMPSASEIAANRWLTEEELAVYSSEYGRTGFQGGLQAYRVGTTAKYGNELRLFAGRTIDVPSMFIGGRSDWGVFQRPGRLEKMQESACTDMRGVHLVDGAGHWVQQEQPEAVLELLLAFLREL
jgi:pimeloyl-ACP methyl ester carboxylesterase